MHWQKGLFSGYRLTRIFIRQMALVGDFTPSTTWGDSWRLLMFYITSRSNECPFLLCSCTHHACWPSCLIIIPFLWWQSLGNHKHNLTQPEGFSMHDFPLPLTKTASNSPVFCVSIPSTITSGSEGRESNEQLATEQSTECLNVSKSNYKHLEY